MFSLLSIGWQGRRQGWSLGVDVGLQLHLLMKQAGRMFSTNEDFFYYSNSSPLYKRWAYSVHFRPQLEYALTPKLGLVFRPELNLSLNNQLLMPNITALLVSYQASVGLRLKW